MLCQNLLICPQIRLFNRSDHWRALQVAWLQSNCPRRKYKHMLPVKLRCISAGVQCQIQG